MRNEIKGAALFWELENILLKVAKIWHEVCKQLNKFANDTSKRKMVMIDYDVLKNLVLTTFNENPNLSVNRIIPRIEKLAAQLELFPSEDECYQQDCDHSFYKENRLNPADTKNVKYIIWNLIRDRLLDISEERLN